MPLVRCLRSGHTDAMLALGEKTLASSSSIASAAARRPARFSVLAGPAPRTAAAVPTRSHFFRAFSVSSCRPQDASTTTTTTTTTTANPSSPSTSSPGQALEGWELDPNMATLPWAERELIRRGTPPVGSRRRRAAILSAKIGSDGTAEAADVPFELMPYQCFQEARKILQADRAEKLRQIAVETAKIRKLEAVGGATGAEVTSRGGEAYRQKRLASLRAHVEELKILADINDPQVKRRFEDGLGDMNKPIYRHLAEQQWRGRPLRLLQQRVEQFHIVPDLLAPSQLKLRADVELFFRSYKAAPGAIVDSLISEVAPRLRVQVFDRGTRYVSVVVVDADVPDMERDLFTRRCHFLAVNVPLGPATPSLPLSHLDAASQVVLPWMPAFAQKGSSPHRLAVFVLEQRGGGGEAADALDTAALQKMYPATATSGPASLSGRDNFSVRRFVAKHGLVPVGCTLFRTEWDAGTAGVMERAGIPGADVELKPVRLASLKPPRRARGWEARRQGPKYRHLWKYTHRIASPKRKFVR